MVETINIHQRTVYFQMSTANQSFIKMHQFLKQKGIQNNNFFLVILDPDLAGIDPRDPRLNVMMKQKVLVEVKRNYWYFLREVIRIPGAGEAKGGGSRYELNRGNLAMNFCFMLNFNVYGVLPRQTG